MMYVCACYRQYCDSINQSINQSIKYCDCTVQPGCTWAYLMQAVNSEMWNAAMLAQSRTHNQQGLYTTWLWAQEAHSKWKIHDPHCYLQVAQGVAAVGGHPVQGLPVLLATTPAATDASTPCQANLQLVGVNWQDVCMYLSVCRPACLSVCFCLYVGPSVCLSVCVSLCACCLSDCMLVCLRLALALTLF